MSAKSTAKFKNPDNPFAGLNPSQFPSEREKSGAAKRVKPNRQSVPSGQKPGASFVSGASGADNEDDAEMDLFLQAVGPVQGLNAGKKNPAPQTPSLLTVNRNAGTDAVDIPDKDAVSAFPPPDGIPTELPTAAPPSASRNDKMAQALARSLAACSEKNASIPSDRPKNRQQRENASAKPEPGRALLNEAVGLPNPDEESGAFYRAVADVAPLTGKGRAVPPEPIPTPTPEMPPHNPLQDIVDGKVEFALSGTDEFMEGHVVGLDLMTVGKLQARQYSPEAHIDLHGLNSEQAFHQLVTFFRGAYHKGVRTALVVTGRGLNSPNGTPVLRYKVQQWFTQEPFRRVVLAFCTAKREDGGPGALYVLLRKYRKNSGKVRWDAMPTDPDLFL